MDNDDHSCAVGAVDGCRLSGTEFGDGLSDVFGCVGMPSPCQVDDRFAVDDQWVSALFLLERFQVLNSLDRRQNGFPLLVSVLVCSGAATLLVVLGFVIASPMKLPHLEELSSHKSGLHDEVHFAILTLCEVCAQHAF